MPQASGFIGKGASGIPKPRILFVCYGNSCRSQIAETFARHYGMGFLIAVSAGILPSPRVSSRARKTMAERGVRISFMAAPKPLSAFDLSSFNLIVNMTEFSLPIVASPVMRMTVPDMRGVGEDVFREIRDEIERQVIEIVARFRPKPAFRPILFSERSRSASAAHKL